jgi:hypothetical protein
MAIYRTARLKAQLGWDSERGGMGTTRGHRATTGVANDGIAQERSGRGYEPAHGTTYQAVFPALPNLTRAEMKAPEKAAFRLAQNSWLFGGRWHDSRENPFFFDSTMVTAMPRKAKLKSPVCPRGKHARSNDRFVASHPSKETAATLLLGRCFVDQLCKARVLGKAPAACDACSLFLSSRYLNYDDLVLLQQSTGVPTTNGRYTPCA